MLHIKQNKLILNTVIKTFGSQAAVKQLYSFARNRVGAIILLSVLFVTSCSQRKINSSIIGFNKNSVIQLTPEKQAKKEFLIEEAKKEAFLNNLETSRKHYLAALKIDPACDACYYELAMLYFRAGYLINAVNLSREAYNLDTTNFWYKRQLAQLLTMGSNYAEAEKLYTSLLASNAYKPDIYYSLASVYENMRQYDKALALYDSTQLIFGFNEEVAVRRQQIFSALGKYTQSIEEAEMLINYDPDDPRFRTLLGDAYAQAMHDSMAIISYNSALAIDPAFPPALLGKAEIARKAGNFEGYFSGLKLYYDSDKIDEQNKVEYLSLVLRLPSFAEYFKADIDTLFFILNNKYPESNDIRYLQSNFYMQSARPDSAISMLNSMLKADSTNFTTWNQLSSIQYSLMRWNDLKTTSNQMLTIFPDRPIIYMYRGIAFSQLKDLTAASSDFENALKIGSKDVEFSTQIHAFLGDLYHQMGKEKKSFEHYDRVLAVDSLNATVLNNYAYFMAIKGKNFTRAYEMSKKAVEIEPSNVSFLDTFGWILFLQGKLTESRAIFRQAMAGGGKDSAVVLDHYADILYALGEYDTASIYWNQALDKPDCENKEEIKQKLLKLNKK